MAEKVAALRPMPSAKVVIAMMEKSGLKRQGRDSDDGEERALHQHAQAVL